MANWATLFTLSAALQCRMDQLQKDDPEIRIAGMSPITVIEVQGECHGDDGKGQCVAGGSGHHSEV